MSRTPWPPPPSEFQDGDPFMPILGQTVPYRVAFLRRGARLTVALVEAESPDEAVDTARQGLTLGELLDVEAIEVERSNRSVRELLA